MEHEDLQSKGFFGILGFSIRLIHSRRRLFLPLAAAVLLPLAALSMAGTPITARILDYDYTADHTYNRRASRAAGAVVFALLYGIAYLFVVLLAAGAAIHAAASAYAAKEAASLRRSLLRAAPRAWARLLGTSFWGLLLNVVYLVVGGLVLGLAVGLAGAASGSVTFLRVLAIIFACLVAVVFFLGAVYVSTLWHVAVAATVLEGAAGPGAGGSGCWGIAAIRKARALVRGRAIMCGALLVLFEGLIYVVQNLCWGLTLYVDGIPLVLRIVLGALILLALTGLFLLGTTVLTAAYLVLKAWHGEPVDPVSLTARLDACAGEYERMVVPNGGTVQMSHQMV